MNKNKQINKIKIVDNLLYLSFVTTEKAHNRRGDPAVSEVDSIELKKKI
jgi:hypothetical protein